jgi:hypothetical protein
MSKRALQKVPDAVNTSDSLKRLRDALAKRTKGDLIDVLVDFATNDPAILRRLDLRFKLEAPSKELVALTRQAIASATAFDPRDANYNFDYDHEAYSAVKRNLGRLVELGQLASAMELSLELMKRGSHQIEMSDEGLMTDEVEECLQVVIEALGKCDLSAGDVKAWCEKMLRGDCVGLIRDKEIRALRDKFKASQK